MRCTVLVESSMYVSTDIHPSNDLVSGKATFKVSLRSSNIPSFAGKDTITKFFILTPIYKQI